MDITPYPTGRRFNMGSRSHPIVLYLDRAGFMLYQDVFQNVLQFIFPEDAVRDLEVLNKEQLIGLIEAFIEINKILPSVIIIVLADSVVFQGQIEPLTRQADTRTEAIKTYSLLNKEYQVKEVQAFLENVPFEDILAKLIKIEQKTVLVAANKELVATVVAPFQRRGCVVETISPSLICERIIDFTSGLSPQTAQLVLQRLDLIKLGNMLVSQQQTTYESQSPETNQDKKEKPTNVRLYILIAIFVILLGLLAVVYRLQFAT